MQWLKRLDSSFPVVIRVGSTGNPRRGVDHKISNQRTNGHYNYENNDKLLHIIIIHF